MSDIVEKRKNKRLNVHVPIRFRKLRGSTGNVGIISITKNLGEGGIRFRTNEFISMACRLILEMEIPVYNKPLKAITKVAWIRKTADGSDYEVGNQFLEMSKGDKELVIDYMDSLDELNNTEDSEKGEEKETAVENV